MAVVEELLRSEEDGTISFGNHVLENKAKLEDFEHCGDLYKVKTYKTMTKLERNGMFVYESVPGTAVESFKVSENVVSFKVSGEGDAQITLELEADSEYTVYMNDVNVGDMSTNLSAKLSISAELGKESVEVEIVKK